MIIISKLAMKCITTIDNDIDFVKNKTRRVIFEIEPCKAVGVVNELVHVH